MCSVMAQRASSLDFRGGGGGLEAEPVEIEKWVHLCREHMSYFFCLIGKGEVRLTETCCATAAALVLLPRAWNWDQNLGFILVLLSAGCIVIWS